MVHMTSNNNHLKNVVKKVGYYLTVSGYVQAHISSAFFLDTSSYNTYVKNIILIVHTVVFYKLGNCPPHNGAFLGMVVSKQNIKSMSTTLLATCLNVLHA